jgi:hypothetical protein
MQRRGLREFLRWGALGGVVFAGSTLACSPPEAGQDDDGADADATPDAPRIAGRVVDPNGTAIAGVAIVIDGETRATTDASGAFDLEADAAQTIVLALEADGFVRGLERVTVSSTATALRVTMLPQAPAIPLDADAGGRVTGQRGASMDAPPGAFVDRQGRAISGMVDVHLTPLNPSLRAELDAYPGDGRARTATGDTVQLETFGVVDVTVRQGDVDLTIAEGMGVSVEFPLPDPNPATPPATIPLWGFDEVAGVWTEEGTATLDAERGVYVGTIGHLSPWNCDQALEATCLRGAVTDASGDGIEGAYVIARGVDYIGDASAVAGEGGEFCVPVRRDSRVEITAYLPGGEELAREVDSGSEGTDLPPACDDPRCLDAGTWQFNDVEIDDGDAPDWSGDACVDDGEAKLAMTLDGYTTAELQWSGSAWFATCGALSGSTSADSTVLMYQDPALALSVMVELELGPAETSASVPASVYLFEQLGNAQAGWWIADNCVAEVSRNEVLAPGLFGVAGRGECSSPAMSLVGSDAPIDIVGAFEFAGVVVASDVPEETILQCCAPYWQ